MNIFNHGTHVIAAFATVLCFDLQSEQWVWAMLAVLLLASLPDYDLRIGIKHRSITHSLFIPLTLYIVSLLVPEPYNYILFYSALVITSHDLLDTLTWSGVELLAPLSTKKIKFYIWQYIPGFSRMSYDTQKQVYTLLTNIVLCVWIVYRLRTFGIFS